MSSGRIKHFCVAFTDSRLLRSFLIIPFWFVFSLKIYAEFVFVSNKTSDLIIPAPAGSPLLALLFSIWQILNHWAMHCSLSLHFHLNISCFIMVVVKKTHRANNQISSGNT